MYSTSLSDAEWACLQRHLPPVRVRGRRRIYPLREILDAIFYLLRSGCPWRLLPRDFPPWQVVYYHFRRFHLRAAERERVGRQPQPTAAIVDSQSVKTVGESACISGYDGHKRIKGRKRHLLVDTLGLPLSIFVTPADMHDQVGARCLLAGLGPLVPRLKKIWADGAYAGEPLATWCRERGGWDLEIVEREAGGHSFSVLPRRWVVERTFGWLVRNRRLRIDYERRVQTSEALMQVATIRLLVSRLAKGA